MVEIISAILALLFVFLAIAAHLRRFYMRPENLGTQELNQAIQEALARWSVKTNFF